MTKTNGQARRRAKGEKSRTQKRTPRKPQVSAGDQSVVIGGNVKNSTIVVAGQREILTPRMAPPVVKLLTGRESFIIELVDKFILAPSTPGSPSVIALRGMGGIGKTTLAAALAHHPTIEQEAPDGTLWASLGPEPDLISLLGEWCQQLGEDFSGYTSAAAQSHRLSTILHDRSMFIVVDDVWRAEDAELFVVGGDKCRVLLTTRNAEVALAIAGQDVCQVETLAEEASLELLQKLAPKAVAANNPGMRQLIVQLGGLPLGLIIAGRLLAEEWQANLGVQGLLNELRASKKRLGMSSESRSLEVVLKMSYEWLPEEAYRSAFRLLGVFGGKPNSFSLEAAARICELDLDATRRVIVTLVNRALLEVVGEGRYALHALVADFASSLISRDEVQPAYLRHAAYFLKICQKYTDDNMKEWNTLDADWNNIRLSANWLSSTMDTSNLDQMYLELVADFASALDIIVQARKPVEGLIWLQAGEAACKQLGRSKVRSWLLMTIGILELDHGNFDQAIKHFEECEMLFRSLEETQGLIYARGNLGLVHHKRGEYSQALAIYEEITKMCEVSKDAYGSAVGHYNQADVYHRLGDAPKALLQLEQTISLSRAESIQDLLVKALTLNSKVLLETAEIEAAFACSQEAYSIAEQTSSNVLLGLAHQALGEVSQSKDELEPAKSHFQESIQLLTNANVQEELAEALVAYGNFLVYIKQQKEAEASWSDAIAIFEKIGATSRVQQIARTLERLEKT